MKAYFLKQAGQSFYKMFFCFISFMVLPILNAQQLSQDLLESLSEEAIKKLTSRALASKDYESLKNLISFEKVDKYTYFINPIYRAVDAKDEKAFKLILLNSPHAKKSETIDGVLLYLRDQIRNIELDEIFFEDSSYYKKVYMFLLEFKVSHGFEIKEGELEMLSLMVDKESFYNFVENAKIDLKAFENINLEHFTLEKPLIRDPNGSSAIEYLLSKTYSECLSEKDVREIYEIIYKTNDIGKAMLDYLAQRLQMKNKSDDFKIVFLQDQSSHYSRDRNWVKVNVPSNPNDERNFLSVAAIAAHEFAHLVVDKVFNVDAFPISLDSYLKGLLVDNPDCEKLFNPNHSYKDYDNDLVSSEEGRLMKKLHNSMFCGDMGFGQLKNLIEEQRVHLNASRALLRKAGLLLKLSSEEMQRDYYLNELMEYLSDHSLIGLFLLTSSIPEGVSLILKNKEEFLKEPKVEYAIATSVINLKKLPDFKDNFQFDLDMSKSKADVYNALVEKYLPWVLNAFNLSKQDAYFIERAADIVFSKKSRRGVEPVVRCVEIDTQNAIHELSPELLDVCDPMRSFWRDYIIPKMNLESSHNFSSESIKVNSKRESLKQDSNKKDEL